MRLGAGRRVVLALAPVVVLASEYPLYRALASAFGARLGYLLAFASYWIGWCLLFPLWVVGWRGLCHMFTSPRLRFGQPALFGVSTLGLPLLLAYTTAFPRALREANLSSVLLSLGLAAVNATGEEVLWRGLYREAFPGRIWSGIIWPSIGFAIWH